MMWWCCLLITANWNKDHMDDTVDNMINDDIAKDKEDKDNIIV